MNIVIYDSRGKDKDLYPVTEIHYEDDEMYVVTVIDWKGNPQKAILYKDNYDVMSREFDFYMWAEISKEDIEIDDDGSITIFSDDATQENLDTLKKYIDL